jgi:hypothetical protein
MADFKIYTGEFPHRRVHTAQISLMGCDATLQRERRATSDSIFFKMDLVGLDLDSIISFRPLRHRKQLQSSTERYAYMSVRVDAGMVASQCHD